MRSCLRTWTWRRMDLQDQDYAESESLLAKALALNPSMPDATAPNSPPTEFANKEYKKALADVERTHGLGNHEQFAEVHIMAGKVLAMQNHRGAAIAQFQLFLIEKPDSPQCDSVRKTLAALQAGRQTLKTAFCVFRVAKFPIWRSRAACAAAVVQK